jgi:tetratricopeptide (TPR) repeat protein
MPSVSRLALAVSLAIGAASVAAGGSAHAQGATATRAPSLSKEERAALSALEAAVNARNYAAAAGALSAAQAAARGSDARYLTAMLQSRLARETANQAMLATAIDAMLASGLAPAADLPSLYQAQGMIALNVGSRERAEASLSRAFDLAPNADTAITLAQLKLERRKNAEALTLIERAIELRKAAGQPVPESWYRRGADLATSTNAVPLSLKFTRELVTAYPTPENWRDAILVYRDVAKPDPTARLDLTRLARLARSLAGERDYLEAAQTFDGAGLSAESRSVLQEGVSSRMVDASKATFKEAIASSNKRATAEKAKLNGLQAKAMAATTGTAALEAGDLFLSAADYATAADLFRAALQKGGVDTGVANTRLGIALALAGRSAEAQAAFRGVTGPRADLAALWLVWLNQRA